jgi:hypothetical protein
MLRDSLKMEQGLAHDYADVLMFHGRIEDVLLVGSGRLAVSPSMQPQRRPQFGGHAIVDSVLFC